MEDTTTKKTLAETTRTEIAAVAARATPEHKQHVEDLLNMAKTKTSTITHLPPEECAIIFLHHNGHNRDWHPETCHEYARRMREREWRFNNQGFGFYVDGLLEDGQHRLSGAAIAGYTIEIQITFGITRDAIVTVDDGKPRYASDHAKLNGIVDAANKRRIVKMLASYMIKMGEKSAALKSEAAATEAIMSNNAILDLAIDIGTNSAKRIVDPVLKPISAFAAAYLMLKFDWPEQRIREKLALFQTGYSMDGEKTPYFVAGELIKNDRVKKAQKDRLNTLKEVGAAIFALVEAEKGVKALSQSAVRNAVKKMLPDPTYPGSGEDEPVFRAAAE
jgi:hypothetical protein